MIADAHRQDAALNRDAYFHRRFRSDEALDRPLASARRNEDREDRADDRRQRFFFFGFDRFGQFTRAREMRNWLAFLRHQPASRDDQRRRENDFVNDRRRRPDGG